MELRPTTLPGCFVVHSATIEDRRGSFTKVFARSALAGFGLETGFGELYYTHSAQGVIRGLHFQVPPHDHEKLVFVVAGEVLDAVLDLRVGSPTFGCHETFLLGGRSGGALYIPRGLAHGFCVTSETATMVYCVTTEHAPQHDAGVRWDSAGISWPIGSPVLSDRDAGLPALSDFNSPFRYK